MNFFCFFTLKNQALDPDPYLDLDPHSFSKPWIRIRMKWMRIRNPGVKDLNLILLQMIGTFLLNPNSSKTFGIGFKRI